MIARSEYSKRPTLSAPQLADLINFTLELPVRLGPRRIICSAVTASGMLNWVAKERAQAERWCEQTLRKEGLLSKRNERRRSQPPSILLQLLPYLQRAA